MVLSKLYIDREEVDNPLVKHIQSRLNLPSLIVENPVEVYRRILSTHDPVTEGKRALFLTRNKGTFIRKCPGTRNYTCCGYVILHIGTYCWMDCSYCILQSFFHPPVMTLFVNHPDLFKELGICLEEKAIRRIGTGEYTDSLIWESWTDLTSRLVNTFAGQKHCVLELKTKTVSVKNLKRLHHQKKTIVSWSLNTPRMIQSEEKGTATLTARLEAAKKCESWGYVLGFHFDPLILYEGCEDEYRSVIERLFSAISAENIAWISLGSFRYMPSLKSIIQQRFPKSKIVYGEFIKGLDGKMRYFKPLRLGLFQQLVSMIKEMAPHVPVYFCMEDDEVWRKCMGFLPSEKGGLDTMLDSRAVELCELEE